MQAAADSSDSGMVSIIGLKVDQVTIGIPDLYQLPEVQVEELCKAAESRTGESIKIANFLCRELYRLRIAQRLRCCFGNSQAGIQSADGNKAGSGRCVPPCFHGLSCRSSQTSPSRVNHRVSIYPCDF